MFAFANADDIRILLGFIRAHAWMDAAQNNELPFFAKLFTNSIGIGGLWCKEANRYNISITIEVDIFDVLVHENTLVFLIRDRHQLGYSQGGLVGVTTELVTAVKTDSGKALKVLQKFRINEKNLHLNSRGNRTRWRSGNLPPMIELRNGLARQFACRRG